MIKDVQAQQLITADQTLQADLLVWAAGVKAPKFLSELGLPTNRIHQIEIDANLQVKGESAIFAIGDCASLIQGEGEQARPVPSLAQAAHQMAATCATNLQALMDGQPLTSFQYHDHGSLLSLSRFQTFGSVLDELFKKNWMLEAKSPIGLTPACIVNTK